MIRCSADVDLRGRLRQEFAVPLLVQVNPQLASGVEHHLVDRVAVAAQLVGEGVQRSRVDNDGDKRRSVGARGQRLLHP